MSLASHEHNEPMTPPRGVATVVTQWGKRAKFCPTCGDALKWTGYMTAVCACNGGDAR